MIIQEIKEQIFHKNGNLSYTCTRGILASEFAYLYPNRRQHPEGYEWIYVGICGKWKPNGKQQWILNYNQKGEII